MTSFITEECRVGGKVIVRPMFRGDRFPEFAEFEQGEDGVVTGWTAATDKLHDLDGFSFGKMQRVRAVRWDAGEVEFEIVERGVIQKSKLKR